MTLPLTARIPAPSVLISEVGPRGSLQSMFCTPSCNPCPAPRPPPTRPPAPPNCTGPSCAISSRCATPGRGRAARAEPAVGLRLAQGPFARAVRTPQRARRGGAEDGLPALQDRARRLAVARRHQRQRPRGRAVWRHRRAGRAAPTRPHAHRHRPGPRGAERAVREHPISGRAAHDAVRGHRPARRAAPASAPRRCGAAWASAAAKSMRCARPQSSA